MKIGRQFPNHPGGMSHGTLLFYTGASPGGLLSSAKDELKFTSYIRLLKCPWLMEMIKNSYRDTDRNTNVDIDIKTELLKDIFRMG